MGNDALIVVEHRDDKVKPVSFEAASFAAALAAPSGGEAMGAVPAGPGSPVASEFASQSGLRTLALQHPNLSAYNATAWVTALSSLIGRLKPRYVIVPHTSTGWDYAPRLAVAVCGSCSTGVTGWREDGGVRMVRPLAGGKLAAEVGPANEGPWVITVMPGAARPVTVSRPGQVEIVSVETDTGGTRSLGVTPSERKSLDLGKAEVIVAAGRGIGGPEHLEIVKELAASFDKGAVGASRPVVDYGWLPLEHQVGQTGQTVCPKLYLACGISGAIQHTAGMSGSELVVAINTDPNAAIFGVAQLGAIKDLHTFLPVLTRKIQEAKNRGSG